MSSKTSNRTGGQGFSERAPGPRLRHVWRLAVWFAWMWPGSLSRETNGAWRAHGPRSRRRWRWGAAMLLSRFLTFAWPQRFSPGRWGHTCRSRPLPIVWWPGLGEGLPGRALDAATYPLRRMMDLFSRIWRRPAYRRGAFAGLACVAAAAALAANGGLFNHGSTPSPGDGADGGRINRLGLVSGGAPASASGGGGGGGGGGPTEANDQSGGAPDAGPPGVVPLSQIGEAAGGAPDASGGGEPPPTETGGEGEEAQAQPAVGVDVASNSNSNSGGGGAGGGGAGGAGGGGGGGSSDPGPDESKTTPPPTPPTGDGGLTVLTPPATETPPMDIPKTPSPEFPDTGLVGPSPEGGDAPPGDGDQGFFGPDTPPIFDTQPAAVPEPSTWAMMILGFGFLGAALRAARREARLPA